MQNEENKQQAMDKDSLSFSSHFSRESKSSLEQHKFIINSLDSSCASDSEEDEEHFIRTLIERETEEQPMAFNNFVKTARLEAITWILKAKEFFGFRFQTAYLSMTYFDRFLSRRQINNEEMWLMKLLPVACLALAAKMEEAKIPSLSDFRFESDDFVTKLVGKMELLVLSTLEWKMSSITPFSFLHYFISRFCQFGQSPPTNILTRATSLIMATLREINLMESRPSSIACAAILVVLDQKLTRKLFDTKLKSISHCISLQVEDVFSCYSMMSELKIYQESASVTAIRTRPINDVESSSVSNALSNERKRLINPSDCSFECGVTSYKRFR